MKVPTHQNQLTNAQKTRKLTCASNQRKGAKHDQGQAPIEIESKRVRANNLRQVLNGVTNLASSAILDLANYLSHAGGQLAGAAVIEPADLLRQDGIDIALAELLRLSFTSGCPAMHLHGCGAVRVSQSESNGDKAGKGGSAHLKVATNDIEGCNDQQV